MKFDETVDRLKQVYGSHVAAARALGYSAWWYRHLRNMPEHGKTRPAKSVEYILLKAQTLLDGEGTEKAPEAVQGKPGQTTTPAR